MFDTRKEVDLLSGDDAQGDLTIGDLHLVWMATGKLPTVAELQKLTPSGRALVIAVLIWTGVRGGTSGHLAFPRAGDVRVRSLLRPLEVTLRAIFSEQLPWPIDEIAADLEREGFYNSDRKEVICTEKLLQVTELRGLVHRVPDEARRLLAGVLGRESGRLTDGDDSRDHILRVVTALCVVVGFMPHEAVLRDVADVLYAHYHQDTPPSE